jgi:hypothetical protein
MSSLTVHPPAGLLRILRFPGISACASESEGDYFLELNYHFFDPQPNIITIHFNKYVVAADGFRRNETKRKKENAPGNLREGMDGSDTCPMVQ